MPLHLNYRLSGDPLHSLDIWLPKTSILGAEPVLFILYLHGGAWIDPEQDATEGHTLLEFLHSKEYLSGCKIACASINYRLSTKNSGVYHPMHLNDVEAAIRFLQQHYSLRDCVFIGHSAGASIAVQLFPQFRRDIMAMILLNGIYDLVDLVEEYPGYAGFLSAAFGEIPPPTDSNGQEILRAERYRTWIHASPSTILKKSKLRREHLHELVVLAHSDEDELLSMRQTDAFHELLQSIWGETIQRELIHGKHDDSPQSREVQELALAAIEKVAVKLVVKHQEELARIKQIRSRTERQVVRDPMGLFGALDISLNNKDDVPGDLAHAKTEAVQNCTG